MSPPTLERLALPVVTVLAMDDPEIDPRSAEDSTDTLAGPPE